MNTASPNFAFETKLNNMKTKTTQIVRLTILTLFLFSFIQVLKSQTTIGGVNMGNLTDYLLFYSNGSTDANWQGATKGFVGNVAVDGIMASERTSGTVPYAGTIYTNDATLGAWGNIVSSNSGQAFGSYNQTSRISTLESQLNSAFSQINALTVTPGYNGVSSTSLNGLNTTNGVNETYVININSGFQVSSQINITGDAGDVFILRWDDDLNLSNGYNGQVKFQSGGAIVPNGGLLPSNFINVAGDINSSGGGGNPAGPYPQGPRTNNGTGSLITGASDFNGGGFFTGYWLTTGDPTNGFQTASLSNGIFVGGWYSTTTKFSMTSGTSAVYVAPNPSTTCTPTTSSTNVSVCSNQLPYSWNSNSYNAAGTYVVHLTNAGGCDSAATLNLTVIQKGTIGNYVWNDLNKNGINDEPVGAGINGVTVQLWNASSNTLIGSTLTSNNGSGNPGFYNFDICQNGNYKILFPTQILLIFLHYH